MSCGGEGEAFLQQSLEDQIGVVDQLTLPCEKMRWFAW